MVVVRYRITSGIPASRSASKPAAMASRVASSKARSRSGSTPNSATRSSGACRPASLITSRSLEMVSNDASPDGGLTSRVMCLSSMPRRIRRGMLSMNCSPARIRATLPSSNTRSTPGRPSAAPVMTTGSPRAGAMSGLAGAGHTSPIALELPWYSRRPCSRTPANSLPSSV